MKITFISPYYHNIWESLGVGYIYSYLKNNFKGKLVSSFFHGNFDSDSKILKDVIKSDIVLFSCTSPTYKNGVSLAKKIKKINPSVHIIFGGYHTSAMREIEDNIIDQIVIGEGEEAILSILNGNTDKIVYGKKMQFSSLYWPDRGFIRNDRTLDLCYSMCGERIISIQSRRGCSHNCAMCAESSMTGIYNSKTNPVRVRDAEDVLNEIEYTNKIYKINKFKFLDPTWAFPKQAVIDFCEEKIRRNNDMRWECMAHAAYLTKDIMKLMKESNCEQINIGVESGDQRILNDMRKGITTNKIKKVFKWGYEAKLDMRAFCLLGMPNENDESIKNTKELIRELNPNVFGMTILCPYPGSDFYCNEFKDIDWSIADEYGNDFWKTKNYSNEDLHRIQKGFAKESEDKLAPHQKEIMGI